jgi:ABC-2 type transport system permease protein
MFLSLVRLFLRTLATRGRLAVLTLLGFGMIGLAFLTGSADDPQLDTWRLFSLYALGGLVPVASLVIGSSAFGDLVDDRTLVHLWLRPVPRATLFGAAFVATLVLVLPFSVVAPVVALRVADMPSKAITVGAFSAVLGSCAYSAVFIALGLKVRRALAWGLAYILIWEGAVANAGAGLAKLAIRLSTRSIAYRGFEGGDIRFPLATPTAVIVLVVVTVCALSIGQYWLKRAEVA